MCTVGSFNVHGLNSKKKLSVNGLIDHVELNVTPAAVNASVSAANELLALVRATPLPIFEVALCGASDGRAMTTSASCYTLSLFPHALRRRAT